MKITLLPERQKFLFQNGGLESEYTFQEILESKDWREKKLIKIVHREKNEYGHVVIDCLTRDVFLETMKEGDESYQKERGAWELNTTIHKLYAILDGKDSLETEEEIKNLSKQHDELRQQWLKEHNENVEKVFAIEKEVKLNRYDHSKTKAERDLVNYKLVKKLDKLRLVKPSFTVRDELKKMYYAARDKSKPTITFANVTPEAVKAAYGENLVIQ